MHGVIPVIWLVALCVLYANAQTTDAPANSSSLLAGTSQTSDANTALNCSGGQVLKDWNCIDRDLKKTDSSLLQFLIVAGISVIWIIYLTFYNSRILGFILTKCLNPFIKDGHLQLGSLSFSVLSGKIMFRDVEYITSDSSVYIYDGYCIFRWWRPYKFSTWRKKRDLNQGHTRLSVVISGLEYHVYNRSSVYGRLEELFGLDSQTFVSKSKPAKQTPKKSDGKDAQKIAWWRNLIPVIKISVSYGKVIFGNKLLPSTLVAAFEDVNADYKTTKASNIYDIFMHVMEGTVGSVRVMLIQSPKYDPAVLPPNRQTHGYDPPPRKMGEGYDLIHSNTVSFKYIWDEPGKTGVPLAESKFLECEAKTNDNNEDDDSSVWELEVHFEKRMTLNYGPWADRQINQLWRFYYPLDYQKQQVTEESKEGELREPTSFNMYISLRDPADIDLLFLKNDEPGAIHINVMRGTCVEMHIPMTVTDNGFTTHISGQIMYPNASTSLSYRPLISAEVLSFNITANYPLIWNDEQMWICDIKANKVSASLIFEHKNFIADLMDDWSSKDPADLLSFAPYKMKLSFDLQGFELLLPANEYNWVDCATKRKENALVGLTGQSLKIDFTLPFNSFLASTYTIPFTFHIRRTELCLFLPQSNPAKDLLLNLRDGMDDWNSDETPISTVFPGNNEHGASTTVGDDAKENHKCEDFYRDSHKLRKDPNWGSINEEWVKCWDAPEMDLLISYMWHPVVPIRKDEHKHGRDAFDVNREMEKAEKLMQKSIRGSKKIPFKRTTSVAESSTDVIDTLQPNENGENQSKSKANASVKFDPISLDTPDEISVEFTLKPGSTLFLYGSLLHHFVAIKENYLGLDDKPTDFTEGQIVANPDVSEQNVNPLYYRTLQVTVNVNLHQIRGVLPVHMNPAFKCCPTVLLKRLTFEMDKNYHQTRLQLLLSKLAINVEENISRNAVLLDTEDSTRKKGWLMLMDLQLRGHAMFSGEGLPLGAVSIEYGWLMEVLVGPITGNLTIPQLQLLAQWGEMFVFLMKNSLHELEPAYPNRFLPTAINWEDKKLDGKPIAEGDVKYLMTQVKLDSIKLRVAEKDSALDVSVSPVLISNGNIQFPGVKEAALIRVQEVMVKQRIKKPNKQSPGAFSAESTWIEAGEIRFGSLHSMITVATPEREMCARQTKFLRFHDNKTRRLHFLWNDNVLDGSDASLKSVLSSVRSLKSWGCSFFTPLTSKHPTYFYKSRTILPKQESVYNRPTFYTTHVDDSDEDSSLSEDDDQSDRDSDVFDPGMEYGMSLLSQGKCLLSRSRTLSVISKKSTDANASTADIDTSNANKGEVTKPVKEVVTSISIEEVPDTKLAERRTSRPSLRRQNKILSSTGQIYAPSLEPLSSPAASPGLKKSSLATRKLRSATVKMASSKHARQHPSQPQVSFAPSPEKLSALKKYSSQTDIDVVDSVSAKYPIRRVRSSDSNLYRSAESDFRSTTSLSSTVDEEFYSAESDVNEPEESVVVSDYGPASTSRSDDKTGPVRPGSLPLENEHSTLSALSSSSNGQPVSNKALSPNAVTSVSPVSQQSAEPSSSDRRGSISPPSQSQAESQILLQCYESHLTVSSLNLVTVKEEDPDPDDASEDEGWFDEKFYRLPGFTIQKEGIHPSVMIDKDANASVKSHRHKAESASRELTFDDVDSSGKSTSVSVHLRESLDIQLTPFLLNTITNIVDAATPVVKNDNPLAVVSQLEMHCINEAAEVLPEEDMIENPETQKQGKKKGDKNDKPRPSLKRQKRTDENAEDSNKQALKPGLTVTRPPPGTKLSVRIDRVRINVLQSALDNNKIFSLCSNKLLPTPCITVFSTRLESLNVSVDLNSRKKSRILIENLRKMSKSSTASFDKRPSEHQESRIPKKVSVSSDITTQKHFLVLLNAKATAESLALQMRALTTDGSVPERTSITALSDKDCQAPFCFNPTVISPKIKETVDKWYSENETPQSGSFSSRKSSRYQASGPPKPWGWVMLEAGVDRVRVNVVKQVPVKGTKEVTSGVTSASFSSASPGLQESGVSKDDLAEESSFTESVHVHFADETLKSLPDSSMGGDTEWIVKDTNLHASQGELFIGSVWINVPAPLPENLSTGKAVKTWNLLSCISASITSWLDPADQLTTSIAQFNEEKLTRHCAVIACALTEAFDRVATGKDAPEKPMEPMQLKYDVLTRKAKLLRKDPNFLLSHELQRFLSSDDGRQIVIAAVNPSHPSERHVHGLPALSTLKKGVSALIRQWASHYSGIINSAKRKNSTKNARKTYTTLTTYGPLEEKDETLKDYDRTKQPSLVLPVEPPEIAYKEEESLTQTDAVPKRMPRPVLKPESYAALGAIEEVSASSDIEKGLTSDIEMTSLSGTQAPQTTTAEELVYEQQKSMYSWMSNAAKTNSPANRPQSASSGDGEAQPLMQNEVFGIEETDFSILAPTPAIEQPTSKDKKDSADLIVTNSEEVFQIFLRNAGLDVDSPVPVKLSKDTSFIRGECLGSLSVNAKLKILRIDKQDADCLYNLFGLSRRKKKSMKAKKTRSYYSSLEHARETREPYVLNTTTWPHVYVPTSEMNAKPPPILLCQEIEVKSSVTETDVESKEKKKPRFSVSSKVHYNLLKNRSTLNVGAQLSVDCIKQHVDIALVRLIHQVTQISDNVQQAKTDIQVNKYTGGSVSPDFKVLHRRTTSIISDASNISATPSIRHTVRIDEKLTEEDGNVLLKGGDEAQDDDVSSTDSASSASTEVPHCWEVMYAMVNLYESVPENKADAVDKPADTMHVENENSFLGSDTTSFSTIRRRTTFTLPPHDPYLTLVLKATAGVKKVEMHAAVGDLKLNAELSDLVTKVDHSKEVINTFKTRASSKFTTTLDGVRITLLDQASRMQRKTIANASIKSSSLDACTNHQRESSENIAKLNLGLISFDLSQHPASLHDVVSRGTRQLSAHISEFAITPTVKQSYLFDQVDSGTPLTPTPAQSNVTTIPPMTPITPSALTTLIDLPSQDSSSGTTSAPVNAQFVLACDGISIVASLLPSLRASYCTKELKGEGHTGTDAAFLFSLPDHVLQLTTTNEEEQATTVINLPNIDIEGEYKQGGKDALGPSMEKWKTENFRQNSDGKNTQLLHRPGNYLSVSVNIGHFEHSLTTDLLNQLIFLQEVFLKEINEMIDKVSKTNKPVSLWSESSLKTESPSSNKPMLYQLELVLEGIQITAATPSSNAVRLKTGKMMFELSNRVIQNSGRKTKKKKKGINVPKYLKQFGKAQVDLTLSLGTLVQNGVGPEAEDDFQKLAYFTTRIGLQNTKESKDETNLSFKRQASAFAVRNPSMEGVAAQKISTHSMDDRLLNPEMSPAEESDNSVVLISLTRPLFFIQPTAFDKAILVYLSYKNAYEDWKEQQRTILKTAKQVRDVIQSVRTKPAPDTTLPNVSNQRTSSVYLQLSVNDMGICLPDKTAVHLHQATEQDELPSALVLTIDNTLISASYRRSLETKGHMKGFCMRFADDFQPSSDWKHISSPGVTDLSTSPKSIMNALIVPEGTYEICSDTNTYHGQSCGTPISKTTVNVVWKMKGMDVHFDTKIGSYFSRLTDTLLAITGQDEQTYYEELDMNLLPSEEDCVEKQDDAVDGSPLKVMKRSFSNAASSAGSTQPVPLSVQEERNRKIEHKINEQAKVVKDLRQLGAKQSYVDEEEQRLHELEAALSSNFRKTFKNRLRRSSIKASNKKDTKKKFKQTHQRTKSATVGDTGNELPPKPTKSSYSTLPQKGPDGGWKPQMPRGSQSADTVGYPGTPDQNFGHTDSFYSTDSDSVSTSDEDEVDGPVRHHTAMAAEHNQPAKRSLHAEVTSQFPSSKSENSLANISHTTSAPPEAEIQLELDVKVEVDGGKIECHPYLQEIDISAKQDSGMIPPTYSTSKVRNFVKNTTIFYIPGMDVRVQYNSAASGIVPSIQVKKEEKMFTFSPLPMETVQEQNENTPESGPYTTPPVNTETIATINQDLKGQQEMKAPVPDIEITTPSNFVGNGKSSVTTPKRACVRARLNLQSLPEMVISPYLLDFLEQTFNELATLDTPAHSFSQKHSTNSSRQGSLHGSYGYSDDETSDMETTEQADKPATEGSVVSYDSTLVSLPLDVVVEVNVQPSQVRFNCVPMSRVECLLQIPSIDLKFSSIEEEVSNLSFSNEEDKKTESLNDSKGPEQTEIDVTVGGNSQKGLNFTAKLSDFSVYVFHPYGGKQSASGAFPTDIAGSFMGSPASNSSDSPFSKSGSGRRDSLSVNLEFVEIELIRRRKGDTILVADIMSPGITKSKVDNFIVHVIGALDIGKASFKYDMKRLNEILAFPRAWYRRSIARRLFLGDASEQPTTNSPHVSRKEQKKTRSPTAKATSSSRSVGQPTVVSDSGLLSFLTVDTPLSPAHRQLGVKSSSKSGFSKDGDEADGMDNVSTSTGSMIHWQALVQLKLKMSRLDVEMNMSNVMGNTVWSCNALTSSGKLMFHSNGDRDITLTCELDNSQINARGGIIGGHIELDKFAADCHLLDPAETEPSHKLKMTAQSLDGKIEYMGGCAMMGQLTQADFELKDEWKNPVQSMPSIIDKSTVYVHCDLGWRVFQLSISRSSTPDVIKMLSKLEEFFSQQLHSSVRMLSHITQSHSTPGSPKKHRDPPSRQPSVDQAAKYDHRRHWPPVFKAVAAALADSELFESGRQLRNRSVLLGGSACLHGEGLIVVCFHGTNFRSRSWVLFNILQPNIVFSTEVQEIEESASGNETSTLAIQSLTVNLGHDKWLSRTHKPADPMATVSRVTRSRNQNPPPGSSPIAEWFAYMTASRNEELKMLRTLNDLSANAGQPSSSSQSSSQQSRRVSEAIGGVVYSHEADIIFALPKVQLDFKTEHIQGPTEPDPKDTENKPVVECSFVTEFTDHICVTMDVELLLFLHDLISSYLKEKQQALSSRTKLSSLGIGIWDDSMSGSYSSEPSVPKPLPIDPIDMREFICKTWQLEPTITLISWAGRRIEPVGVDFILQKLGFQQARTTIPKWFQRGVLDLLDKGLAVAVEKLVVAIINDQKKKK